jgi:hypothetical protein
LATNASWFLAAWSYPALAGLSVQNRQWISLDFVFESVHVNLVRHRVGFHCDKVRAAARDWADFALDALRTIKQRVPASSVDKVAPGRDN